MNEKEMVEFWKGNEKPFGLCPKEYQEWFRAFCGPVRLFGGSGWVQVGIKCEGTSLFEEKAYQIEADYEPENPEKRRRWVECEVFQAGDYHQFRHPRNAIMSLVHAPGMVGFGGVWYPGLTWSSNLCATFGLNSEKPIAPTKVRFWVED